MKKIETEEDLKKWRGSVSYRKIFSFFLEVNKSLKSSYLKETLLIESSVLKPESYQVQNKTLIEKNSKRNSDVLTSIRTVLLTIKSWIHEIPLETTSFRFGMLIVSIISDHIALFQGNPSFRLWFDKLEKNCSLLIQSAIGTECLHLDELIVYFLHSFGNNVRIDYGTGHELSFFAFLYCLYCLKLIQPNELNRVATCVFKEYLSVTHLLIDTYHMEPAGSQGVWNLDDYSFIPFVWGSSQLVNCDDTLQLFISPKFCTENSQFSLFFEAVEYVFRNKTGSFYEHSPLLVEISQVSSWEKVNNGLVRMYEDYVLGKFPIMQHFFFGKLIQLKRNKVTTIHNNSRNVNLG